MLAVRIRGSSNQELLKEGAAGLVCKWMVPFPFVLEHVALFPFRGQLLSAKPKFYYLFGRNCTVVVVSCCVGPDRPFACLNTKWHGYNFSANRLESDSF